MATGDSGSRETESPIKIYLREIGEVSLISPSEEVRLANQIQRGIRAEIELKKIRLRGGGGKAAKGRAGAVRVKALTDDVERGNDARQRMIKANLRLVVKIAQDYANYGLPLLDLISEGNIGLMKAVERFEPRKGAKLSTYAAWWIKQAVKRALANQGKTIRLPVHMADKISRMRRIASQLSEEFGRDPTDEELAEELGISTTKVSQLRSASVRPASLNSTIGDTDGSELGELVGDEAAFTPSEWVQTNDITNEMLRLLGVLDERERIILKMRYGLDGGDAMTLEEVGERFKVTRERIRQLQNIGLRKLRRAIDRKDRCLSDG
ncbi:MAG TPA: sigma-70 family RNA polymerase sigma factor [Verrucomicrobiae bacterium]|nr:sigma-70 family RNA polymerase sigma factor [Verrucomicrobiae bacterium]